MENTITTHIAEETIDLWLASIGVDIHSINTNKEFEKPKLILSFSIAPILDLSKKDL